jgi:TatD DNase family protein
LNLPVIIHSRDADDETVEILTEEFSRNADIPVRNYEEAHKNVRVPLRGIMHCFGGTPRMAEELMPLGFMISFAGNVTFKKAENLRDAARVVPVDRLLIETDCPFLTPIPFRGKRNEPAYVEHTARFLADFYEVSFEDLAEKTTRNFIEFFGFEGRIAI